MAQKEETRHLTITNKLLQEAKPVIQGKPEVRVLPLGEKMGFGKQAGQQMEAGIPFMKGQLRADLVVSHILPASLGQVHVVHAYSRSVVLPVETVMALKGRIPRPVIYQRGSFRSGDWVSNLGKSDQDKFCKYLTNLKKGPFGRLESRLEWELNLGRSKIKLPWTIQLVPFSDTAFLFLLRQPYETTFFAEYKSSRLGLSLEIGGYLQKAISAAKYTGQIEESRFLAPSLGLLALQQGSDEA